MRGRRGELIGHPQSHEPNKKLQENRHDAAAENGRSSPPSETEFEALLVRAAETGARRDLRSLLAGFRLARRTAVQTTVRIITTAVMLALLAGIAIKLKIFGGGP